jgi:hypothetical protein
MEQNVTKFGAPPAASLKRPVRNSVTFQSPIKTLFHTDFSVQLTFKDDGLLPMRSAMMPLVVAPTINPTDAARTAYST